MAGGAAAGLAGAAVSVTGRVTASPPAAEALAPTRAAASARMVEGVMVGVQPRSALIYALAALGLVAMSAVAAYFPARRATRIDPIEALRPN